MTAFASLDAGDVADVIAEELRDQLKKRDETIAGLEIRLAALEALIGKAKKQ